MLIAWFLFMNQIGWTGAGIDTLWNRVKQTLVDSHKQSMRGVRRIRSFKQALFCQSEVNVFSDPNCNPLTTDACGSTSSTLGLISNRRDPLPLRVPRPE